MSSHGGRSEWRVPIKRHVAQRTPHGVSHEHNSDPDGFVPSSNRNVTVPASTLWTPKPEADRIDNEIRLRVRVPAHLMAKYATMLAKRERPGNVKTKHVRKPSVKRDSVVSDDAQDVPAVKMARSSQSSVYSQCLLCPARNIPVLAHRCLQSHRCSHTAASNHTAASCLQSHRCSHTAASNHTAARTLSAT